MYRMSFAVEHDYSLAEALVVPVRLRFSKEEVRADAFVDTGSTFCVFKLALAEMLGLSEETGEATRFSTVTGALTAYGHTVVLETFGYSFETTVYFADGLPRNVLGRRGWLDRVRLGVVEHEGKLYLSRYDE